MDIQLTITADCSERHVAAIMPDLARYIRRYNPRIFHEVEVRAEEVSE